MALAEDCAENGIRANMSMKCMFSILSLPVNAVQTVPNPRAIQPVRFEAASRNADCGGAWGVPAVRVLSMS